MKSSEILTPKKLRHFTTTVLRFPELAKDVRFLDLSDFNLLCGANGHIVRRDQKLPGAYDTNPEDRSMLSNAIHNLSISKTNTYHLRSALRFKSLRSDTILVVLLVSLPYLERLEIGLGHANYDGFDNEFLVDDLVQDILCEIPGGEVLINKKPILERLTHLKIECRDSSAGDPVRLMRWLQLPSLTHFFGTKWSSLNLEHEDTKYLPTVLTPSIVHLEFRDCAFTAPYLHRILAGCDSLKTLIYQRGWSEEELKEEEYNDGQGDGQVSGQTGQDNTEEDEEEGDKDIMLVSDLTAALRTRSHTLKFLELSFAKCAWHDWEHLYLLPVNLACMEVLTKLHIAAGYLIWSPHKESMYGEYSNGLELELFDRMGMRTNPKIPLHARLPRTLELLSITSPQNQTELRNLIPALCTLLRYRQKHLPNLQELRIEAPIEGDPTVFGLQWLKQEADNAGVQLRIIDNASTFAVSWLGPLENVPEPQGVSVDWGMNGEFKWGHRFWQAPRFHTLHEGTSSSGEEGIAVDVKYEN